MWLKEEVGGRALISHGNYIVDHGKPWKSHGIVFSNFCGNPVDSNELYCVTKEQPHIAYQSLYLYIFLSLQ